LTTVDTFVGSQGSFMSSSHLIAGEEEAILVDALFTKSDAQQMVDRVSAIVEQSPRRDSDATANS
jgi:Protein of unknown function (DUF2630)